ncbi:UDP-glucose 4-epimerase GalE [Actinomycetospora cinnamomea]|uniref:UDP-glucose 4-epimerase n=1 Tax=Actinomycetospora cinnamomea TaxID=663609 RepID=A0A2U1F735_9PSEU|nr:UDP-glucose 4-epimerase GalE [Actinomycetospora cinnamomea]PVZ08005.1 UDP-galactose 4-epimerase [Actinomycetospora cinnamomea]
MAGRWLVTGGAGYIGAHTVRALRARGDTVVVLDDLSAGFVERVDDDVPLVRASTLDEDAVTAALTGHRLDGVLHFAARKSVPESVAQPLYYWRENVEGLRAVLSACARADVERFVYSSSAAVYGATTGAAVTEDAPCEPVNPYGTTKLVGEWLLADVHRATGLRYVALRYFNVAGAHDARLADRGRENLVPIALAAVARGDAPTVFGADYDTPDGSCVRDFVHVDDLADAHVAATALLDGPCAETFNVGVGRGYSVLEVMATVARVAGRPVDPVIADRRPGDPAAVVADVTRIRERLGWTALHDLDDIVTSAWEARVTPSASGS